MGYGFAPICWPRRGLMRRKPIPHYRHRRTPHQGPHAPRHCIYALLHWPSRSRCASLLSWSARWRASTSSRGLPMGVFGMVLACGRVKANAITPAVVATPEGSALDMPVRHCCLSASHVVRHMALSCVGCAWAVRPHAHSAHATQAAFMVRLLIRRCLQALNWQRRQCRSARAPKSGRGYRACLRRC